LQQYVTIGDCDVCDALLGGVGPQSFRVCPELSAHTGTYARNARCRRPTAASPISRCCSDLAATPVGKGIAPAIGPEASRRRLECCGRAVEPVLSRGQGLAWRRRQRCIVSPGRRGLAGSGRSRSDFGHVAGLRCEVSSMADDGGWRENVAKPSRHDVPGCPGAGEALTGRVVPRSTAQWTINC